LTAVRQQHGDHGSRPRRQDEVDQPERGPNGRMTKTHRRALDRDDAEPERGLAHRAPAPQRLHHRRVAPEHDERQQEEERGGDAHADVGVGRPDQGGHPDDQREQRCALDRPVDHRGQAPRPDVRRLQLEGHGFGRHHLVLRRRHRHLP
jgi:hypothetical protein